MSTITPVSRKVIVEHEFSVTAERVFDAFLQPDLVVEWMHDVLTQGRFYDARIDPRVGGRFELFAHGARGPIVHRGVYLEIDRPTRLCFTWITHGTGLESTVEVSIDDFSGGCRLRLIHHLGAVGSEIAKRARDAWGDEFRTLDKQLQ